MSLARSKHFYGWNILALATFSQLVSVGFTIYLLGLYMEPLSKTLSATPAQIGWASSILMLVASGMGPVLGYWVDKGKIRFLMCLGSLLLALGFLALSKVESLSHGVIVCIFLLAPGSAMLGVITVGAMLSQWFQRRRGLVLGIAASGISLGGFLMPLITAFLFENVGWRDASMVLGAFIGLTMFPAAWLIAVTKPADIGQFPDGDESAAVAAVPKHHSNGFNDFLKRLDFWLISAVVGTLNFSSLSMVTFLIPYSRELHIDVKLSALMLSLYAGSAFFGKFLSGWLSDLYTPRRILTVATGVMALGLLPMLMHKEINSLVLSAALTGLAAGGIIPLWAALIVNNFGADAFGRVKGVMSLVLTSVAVIPGPLGGYIYGIRNSYSLTFSVVFCVLLCGVLISLFVPGYGVGARRASIAGEEVKKLA